MTNSYPRRATALIARLTAIAMCAVALAASADDIRLPPYKAIYNTSIKGMKVEGHRTLQINPAGMYSLSMSASLLMLDLSEDSTFTIENSVLKPHSYRYKFEKPLVKDDKQVIEFDWAQGTFTSKGSKKDWSGELQSGYADRLSVLSAMRVHLLAHGPSDYQANIIDRKKMKQYTLLYKGTGFLETPLGRIETILMERAEDSKRSTKFWLAPEWNYQLIRFKQVEDDGDIYELNLQKLDFLEQ